MERRVDSFPRVCVALEIPGHVYYLFNSDGKIIRVHNEIAGSGPDADKYASMLADAMIKFWGAKLEDGLEHARSALVDVVERLNTLDPATVVEHTTDDGEYGRPSGGLIASSFDPLK